MEVGKDELRPSGKIDCTPTTESTHKREVDNRDSSPDIQQTIPVALSQHSNSASKLRSRTPSPPSGRRWQATSAKTTIGRKRPRSSPEEFRPGEPSPEYLALANRPPSSLDPPRKLVILDLNGTLLCRIFRKSTKRRPYLRAFTRFICTHQGLEPMIWSSARPDNVKAMSELAFGPFKHHLKAIWARDTLGLSAQDFQKKVQTVKDLNSVWHQLSDDSGIFTGEPLTYSALNTILVDDSLVKAHLQPHNHICLPDYDATLRELDVEQSLTDSGDGDALSKEDAQIGISSRYDLSLVAVMGVLDELANQDSVCSWISSGGLRNIPGLSTGTSGEIGNKGKTASELLNEGAPFTSSSPGHNEIPAPGPKRRERRLLSPTEERPPPETSPSPSPSSPPVSTPAATITPFPMPPYFKTTPTLWYEDSVVFNYWVSRGVQTAKHFGIPLEHGVLSH